MFDIEERNSKKMKKGETQNKKLLLDKKNT